MQIDVKKAAARISDQILQTPLFYSKYLSALNKGNVYLKLEMSNAQDLSRQEVH